MRIAASNNHTPSSHIRQHIKRALRQALRARRLAAHAIEDHPNPTALHWQEQAAHVLSDAIAALHAAQDYTAPDALNEAHALARRVARLRLALQELAARDGATPAMRQRMQDVIDADDFLSHLPGRRSPDATADTPYTVRLRLPECETAVDLLGARTHSPAMIDRDTTGTPPLTLAEAQSYADRLRHAALLLV